MCHLSLPAILIHKVLSSLGIPFVFLLSGYLLMDYNYPSLICGFTALGLKPSFRDPMWHKPTSDGRCTMLCTCGPEIHLLTNCWHLAKTRRWGLSRLRFPHCKDWSLKVSNRKKGRKEEGREKEWKEERNKEKEWERERKAQKGRKKRRK